MLVERDPKDKDSEFESFVFWVVCTTLTWFLLGLLSFESLECFSTKVQSQKFSRGV